MRGVSFPIWRAWASIRFTHGLLIPFLGAPYGESLENQELRRVYDEGAFWIDYYDHHLPVSPSTYGAILEPALAAFVEQVGVEDEHVQELQSILTAVQHLP